MTGIVIQLSFVRYLDLRAIGPSFSYGQYLRLMNALDASVYCSEGSPTV
jgi:hypothetical protein